MKTEYIIWGIAPEEKYEQVLHTQSKTFKEAKNLCKYFEEKNMATKCRVHILDLSVKPDFVKTINFKQAT